MTFSATFSFYLAAELRRLFGDHPASGVSSDPEEFTEGVVSGLLVAAINAAIEKVDHTFPRFVTTLTGDGESVAAAVTIRSAKRDVSTDWFDTAIQVERTRGLLTGDFAPASLDEASLVGVVARIDPRGILGRYLASLLESIEQVQGRLLERKLSVGGVG